MGNKRLKFISVFLSCSIILSPSLTLARPLFTNLPQIIQNENFWPYLFSNEARQTVKVAIFDSDGFNGLPQNNGWGLTTNNIQSFPHESINTPIEQQGTHGYYIARLFQAFFEVSEQTKRQLPEIRLFHTNTWLKFRMAIDAVVAEDFHIVLNASDYDHGSNWDKKGLFNKEVNRAMDAGILWVNSAGNHHKRTYNGKVRPSYWLPLPDEQGTLKVQCQNKIETILCYPKITLNWSAYPNSDDIGTKKDLDFFLTKTPQRPLFKSPKAPNLDDDNLIAFGNRRQIQESYLKRPQTTFLPREVMVDKERGRLVLSTGTYYLHIYNASQNFDSQDIFRVLTLGDNTTLPSHTSTESLLNPADHTEIITVGSTSQVSSISKKFNKPELYVESHVELAGIEIDFGSSGAATIVAVGLTLLKSLNPNLTRNAFLEQVSVQSKRKSPTENPKKYGPPLENLNFIPTGTQRGVPCFRQVSLSQIKNKPEDAQWLLEDGYGTLVEVQLGERGKIERKIFTERPVEELIGNAFPVGNEMVTIAPNHSRYVRNRGEQRNGEIEVLKRPLGQFICGNKGDNESMNLPSYLPGNLFHMPNR